MTGPRVLVACEFSGTVRDAFRAQGIHAVSCDLLPTKAPGIHYCGNVGDLLDGWEPVQFQADCDPEGDAWCATSNCDPDDCACLGPTQDDVEYRETADGVLLARPVDRPQWDLMIAHPPCTFLTCSAEWAYGDGPYHQKVKPGTLVGEARRQARAEALTFVRVLAAAPIKRIAIENPIGHLSSAWRKADQTIQPHWFGHDASKATCLWLKNLPRLRATKKVEPRMVGTRPRWGNQTDSGQNKLSPSDDRWATRSLTYPGIAEAFATQWGALLR